ncbi:hypothetical protein HDU92_008414 [Lobulomyces angularis]|nr:hypothetical protein HDU92_008414 [Lobulomyces angularis]
MLYHFELNFFTDYKRSEINLNFSTYKEFEKENWIKYFNSVLETQLNHNQKQQEESLNNNINLKKNLIFGISIKPSIESLSPYPFRSPSSLSGSTAVSTESVVDLTRRLKLAHKINQHIVIENSNNNYNLSAKKSLENFRRLPKRSDSLEEYYSVNSNLKLFK